MQLYYTAGYVLQTMNWSLSLFKDKPNFLRLEIKFQIPYPRSHRGSHGRRLRHNPQVSSQYHLLLGTAALAEHVCKTLELSQTMCGFTVINFWMWSYLVTDIGLPTSLHALLGRRIWQSGGAGVLLGVWNYQYQSFVTCTERGMGLLGREAAAMAW